MINKNEPLFTRGRLLVAACAIASLLLGVVDPLAAQAQPFTIEDLLQVHRIGDPQVSPDGHYVVFAVRDIDVQADTSHDSLWLLDLTRAGEPRRITPEGATEWNPRWLPDSRGIYFLSARSGSVQVWSSSVGAQGATQVTHLPLDVNTLKVSPHGDRLLVSLDVFPDCASLECTASRLTTTAHAQAKPRTYERLFIRHWNEWSDGRQSHLFAIRLESGEASGQPVDLTRALDADVPSKPRGGDEEFELSPDGRHVAFTARVKGRDEAWSTNFDVYETAADGSGPLHDLTDANPGWDTHPRYSPDGRFLAWKAMDHNQHEADRFHLVVEDLKSGAVHPLAAAWDRSVDEFAFTADSRRILATTDHLGQHSLWSIDLRSGKVALVQEQGQVIAFSGTRQGVVYALASLDAPADLYRYTFHGGRPERLTHLNATLLATRQLSKYEQFTFKGWNGESVSGYIVWPSGFEPGHKYPIALIVHGGPELSYGNVWHYRWNPQIYAGAGYAVINIDFHGSTGYGQAFTDSIRGDWGGKPLEDLRLGLAAASAKYSWLDGRRACALGASYGGYMMNWIEGNWPDGFRCIVNQSGPFDTRSLYYETDEMWLDEWHYGGPQFARADPYERQNPLRFVSGWSTPMLVAHGEQDFNVPYNQGVDTFTALQRRGIESRMVVFPDEGHFIQKPRNAVIWQHEVIAWLNRWLQPGADK
jgi:dipeptidyl aminopeptidase/acylaminoacyl peptidase